jgi:hypothetical protein
MVLEEGDEARKFAVPAPSTMWKMTDSRLL